MADPRIAEARKEGYTDTEIMQFLSPSYGSKFKEAQDAGYSDSEILDHLASVIITPPQEATAPKNKTALERVGSSFSSFMSGLSGGASDTDWFAKAAKFAHDWHEIPHGKVGVVDGHLVEGSEQVNPVQKAAGAVGNAVLGAIDRSRQAATGLLTGNYDSTTPARLIPFLGDAAVEASHNLTGEGGDRAKGVGQAMSMLFPALQELEGGHISVSGLKQLGHLAEGVKSGVIPYELIPPRVRVKFPRLFNPDYANLSPGFREWWSGPDRGGYAVDPTIPKSTTTNAQGFNPAARQPTPDEIKVQNSGRIIGSMAYHDPNEAADAAAAAAAEESEKRLMASYGKSSTSNTKQPQRAPTEDEVAFEAAPRVQVKSTAPDVKKAVSIKQDTVPKERKTRDTKTVNPPDSKTAVVDDLMKSKDVMGLSETDRNSLMSYLLSQDYPGQKTVESWLMRTKNPAPDSGLYTASGDVKSSQSVGFNKELASRNRKAYALSDKMIELGIPWRSAAKVERNYYTDAQAAARLSAGEIAAGWGNIAEKAGMKSEYMPSELTVKDAVDIMKRLPPAVKKRLEAGESLKLSDFRKLEDTGAITNIRQPRKK